MPDVLTSVIDIQTAQSVKAYEALAAAEAKLRQDHDALTKRLTAQEKAIEALNAKLKLSGRGHQDAAEKLNLLIRREEMAAKIAKEHGVAVATARRAVVAFGKDLDRAGKEAAQYATRLDRAQKETRALTRAQGGGLTGAVTRSIQGAAAALVGFTAAAFGAQKVLDALIRVARFGYTSFSELQAAVVSLRKVVNDLDDSSLSKLVGRLEELSTSSVPIATDKLIELGATAAQIGIQSAEGIRLAAETGAQLAEATDLSGEASIKSLSRILAIQGEGIDSLDNLGSALVELGNTSRATEAEIEPIANEIARATANYDIGSPTILGYAAALAELGAKAEGSGTALAQLFKSLLIASKTGKNLEEFARISGMTSDELKRMAGEDIGQAAIRFLQGLGKYGDDGILILDDLGLASQRVGKALLPLAANADRLADRIAVSNQAFEENTALSEEATAAFGKLRADAQRLENALRLVASDGFGAIAPALSTFLKETVAALVVWRHFTSELSAIPAVAAPAAVAIDLLNKRIERDLALLKALPLLLTSVAKIGLDPLANALEAMASAPGGFGLQVLADQVRGLQVALLKAGAAATAPQQGLEETGSIADDVAGILKSLGLESDAVGESFDLTAKKTRALGEALTARLLPAQKKLDDEMADAERLYRANAISLDTLAEARRRYEEASQDLRTKEWEELRDRIKEAKDQLAELAAFEEVDIRVRLDLDNLNAQLSEAISTSLSGDDLLKIQGIEAGFFADVPALVDSYDGIRKSTDEQIRQLDVLTGSFDLIAFAFQDIDSSLGQLITRLAKVAGNISSSIGDIQAGSSLGGAMGALGVVGGVIGIFTEVYGLAQNMLAEARAKRFGVPLTAEVSGGRFRGQAIGSGAVSQSEATATVAAWRDAIEQFRIAVGGFLVDLPEISTRIRNDGKEVELSVGGVVYGIFSSLEEAFEAGLRIAVGQANIEGIGPTVAEALKRVTASSMDELLKLLPTLRELDDVAAGLTASYSRARTASQSWRTELDVEAEALLNHGASLADVVAWRQREIEAQQELLRASGNALAGVSTSFGRLQEWMDSVKAFNEAQGQEAARLNQLTQYAESVVRGEDTPGFGGGSGGGGGGGLGGGGGTGPGNTGGATPGGAGDPMGRIANSTAVREQSEATKEATKASRELTEAYIEQIRESVRLQAEASFFGELADFAETYNVHLSGTGDLRAKIAELEFRAAQIRIALLVEELAANAQLLGITAAQIAQYRQWAAEVGAATFTGIRVSGGGGDRKQKREEQARAAKDFNEEMSRMALLLAGATEEQLAYADSVEELRAKGEAAKATTEQISGALSMLAELRLRDLAADWETAARDLGKTDLKAAFDALRAKAQEDLAQALLLAADNPAAYAAARDAIKAGLRAELEALGRGALSGGSFGLRQDAQATARSIRFLMNHLEELNLTASQVARNVRESVVPQLLDIVKAEAQRVGDVDAYNAALEQEANLNRILTRIKLEGLELELRAANALTPALRAIFDTARTLLDMPSAPVDATSGRDLAAISAQKRRERAEAAASGGAATPEGQSFEDFMRRFMSERERLEDEFAQIFKMIAESSWTAAQKAEALAAAEEELARRREEILNRQVQGLVDLAKGLEAEIAAKKAPKAQIEAAEAAFQSAAAGLDINDEASVQAFQDAAQAYLEAAQNYSGLINSPAFFTAAQEAVQAALAGVGITGAGFNAASATAPSPAAAAAAGASFAAGAPGFLTPTTPVGSPRPAAPSQIIVTPPAGERIDISGLRQEMALMRAQIEGLRRDETSREIGSTGWKSTREAMVAVGNYVKRGG